MHIGDTLLAAGIVTEKQLEEALAYQKAIGGHLGQIMTKLGFVDEARMTQTLAEELQIPAFDLTGFEPDPALMDIFPEEVLVRLKVVPLRREMGALIVGLADPTNFPAMDELRLRYGGSIESNLVAPTQVTDCLNKYYHRDGPARDEHGPERLRKILHEQATATRGEGVDSLTTRQMALGLVRVLVDKDILTAEDVLRAGRRGGAQPTGDAQ